MRKRRPDPDQLPTWNVTVTEPTGNPGQTVTATFYSQSPNAEWACRHVAASMFGTTDVWPEWVNGHMTVNNLSGTVLATLTAILSDG